MQPFQRRATRAYSTRHVPSCMGDQTTTSPHGAKATIASDVDPYGHPRIPYRGYYDAGRCALRREWAERFASCSLAETGRWWEDEGGEDSRSCLKLKGNIENLVGLCKVPVGLAGPLLIRGQHVQGYVLCPYATTEGALVASSTRGSVALTRAGGVSVRVTERCMIRTPAFEMRDAAEAEELWGWLQTNVGPMRKQVRLFSQHTELLELRPVRMGRVLILEFKFFTDDAAGQNMVTTATQHIYKWVLNTLEKELPQVKIVHFWVETLHSGDKRPAAINQQRTRGVYAMAEAWIPESILKSVLKVDAAMLLKTYSLFRTSASIIGHLGFNINVANTLTAVFMATGQDVACCAESSGSQLMICPASNEELLNRADMPEFLSKLKHYNSAHKSTMALEGDGIYCTMAIPSLVVGTVGGGTSLATQRECLQLLGCYGKDGTQRLAEIIVAFALALDLSTLAAVASGQFATAHEKLGKNPPTDGLKSDDFNDDLFATVIGEHGKLTSWTPFNVQTGNSILSELTKSELSKKVGHFGFLIKYTDSHGFARSLRVVVKSKPTDFETSNMINKMAQGCGFALASNYEHNKMEIGFRYCDIREIALADLKEPVIRAFAPVVYHTVCSTSKNIYVMVMEYLDRDQFSLLNTADDTSVWTPPDVEVVMRDVAKIHAEFLGRLDWLKAQLWLEGFSTERMVKLRTVWKELLKHAHAEFPEMWSQERVVLMESAIASLPSIWSLLDSAPHTLTHNDCNPRNICLRLPTIAVEQQSKLPPGLPTGSRHISFPPDPRTMCLYDWELTCVGVPQHDVVEFLAFTLQPSVALSTWMAHIRSYREHLQECSGQKFPWEEFLEVFDMACLDFATDRLLMYTMAHTYKDYMFLPRVIDSLFNYITARIAEGGFSRVLTAAAKL